MGGIQKYIMPNQRIRKTQPLDHLSIKEMPFGVGRAVFFQLQCVAAVREDRAGRTNKMVSFDSFGFATSPVALH